MREALKYIGGRQGADVPPGDYFVVFEELRVVKGRGLVFAKGTLTLHGRTERFEGLVSFSAQPAVREALERMDSMGVYRERIEGNVIVVSFPCEAVVRFAAGRSGLLITDVQVSKIIAGDSSPKDESPLGLGGPGDLVLPSFDENVAPDDENADESDLDFLI